MLTLLAFAALIAPRLAAQTIPCPGEMPAGTRCVQGQDVHGAYYSLAVPGNWNRRLVVFAHGGPTGFPPSPARHAIGYASSPALGLLRLGYALATSSYRDGFFDSPGHVQDLVAAREAFIREFGAPGHTVVYGVSYGSHVAVMAGQLEPSKWDGIVAEDGQAAGMLTRFYRHLDMRVVYQYYCHNLPLPNEAQYPLWRGIDRTPFEPATPANVDAVTAFIRRRAAECTGADLPPERRSPAQARALRNILAVTHIAERDFLREIAGAALSLNAFSHFETHDHNAVANAQAHYAGSDDDAALNRGVARYDADPGALAIVRRLVATGRMSLPLITLMPVHDGYVPPENMWVVAQLYERAGNTARLAQFYDDGTGHIPGTTDHAHWTRVSIAAIQSMFDWIDSGERPTSVSFEKTCATLPAANAEDACTGILPQYRPPSIWTVLPPEGRAATLGLPR